MKETSTHIFFWGSIFSQWQKCEFSENGIMYNTAEKYMMYHKALTFNDLSTADKILKSNDPKQQKALGRQVQGFNDDQWNQVKYQIVVQGTYLKFTQDKGFKNKLLETKDKIIVEASPYDRVWGVGLHYSDDLILDEKNWRGENLLGKALMDVRTRLQKEME